MKNTMCLALIVLAVLPAAAQKASANCSMNGDAAAALGQDYAARVDGLLRAFACPVRSGSAWESSATGSSYSERHGIGSSPAQPCEAMHRPRSYDDASGVEAQP